jgi:hypothetical protein
MRRLISVGLAVTLLLAAVSLALGLIHGLSQGHSVAASSSLTCSVKASCGAGEVAVFRMSGLANAHAGTAAGSAYTNVVCCSGPAGLSASCAVPHTTVLRLWAADNAHAAERSDTSYTTEVCLSATGTGMICQYGSSCSAGYACLATISGTTNAHVADCDGSGDYATKVCCAALLDTDGDGVPDSVDNCPTVPNPGQENTDSGPPPSGTGAIGNGVSIAGNDATVPNGDSIGDACDPDLDNDGIPNASDSDPGGDITYDDNGNGIPCFPPTIDPADHGPSWDTNCNGKLDGVEGSCPLTTNPNGDDDGDGLLNTWEVCKWGTDPTKVDTDGDGKGDCQEVLDTNGNGIFDYGGDVLNMARAALLPAGVGPGKFGRDGDFDLNGNGSIGFGDDVLTAARMAFKVPGYPCK